MPEAPRRGDRDPSPRSGPGWQHGGPSGRFSGAVHGWRSSSCAHCDTLTSREATMHTQPAGSASLRPCGRLRGPGPGLRAVLCWHLRRQVEREVRSARARPTDQAGMGPQWPGHRVESTLRRRGARSERGDCDLLAGESVTKGIAGTLYSIAIASGLSPAASPRRTSGNSSRARGRPARASSATRRRRVRHGPSGICNASIC